MYAPDTCGELSECMCGILLILSKRFDIHCRCIVVLFYYDGIVLGEIASRSKLIGMSMFAFTMSTRYSRKYLCTSSLNLCELREILLL